MGVEDTVKTGKSLLHSQRAAAASTRKVLARVCVVQGCGFNVVRTSNIIRQTENLCFYVKPLNLYMLLINSVFLKDFE